VRRLIDSKQTPCALSRDAISSSINVEPALLLGRRIRATSLPVCSSALVGARGAGTVAGTETCEGEVLKNLPIAPKPIALAIHRRQASGNRCQIPLANAAVRRADDGFARRIVYPAQSVDIPGGQVDVIGSLGLVHPEPRVASVRTRMTNRSSARSPLVSAMKRPQRPSPELVTAAPSMNA
jgi:hypothetical protein